MTLYVSEYLQKIVASYVRKRTIIVDKEMETEKTAGVPQGSIQRPLVWK